MKTLVKNLLLKNLLEKSSRIIYYLTPREFKEDSLINKLNNIFKSNPELFQNSIDVSVDPNYVIGPGDEVIVFAPFWVSYSAIISLADGIPRYINTTIKNDFKPTYDQLNEAGYIVVVVTNQSVIARNICTEKTLELIHEKLEAELKKEEAYVDKIYYCPHHPEGNGSDKNNPYIKECECRKPKAGMLFQAKVEFNIDFSESFMVGDY